jgi:hypothetical protein
MSYSHSQALAVRLPNPQATSLIWSVRLEI